MPNMVQYSRRPSNGGWLLSPFGAVDALDEALNTLSQETSTGFTMDVEDAKDHYEVTAILPGVRKDDVAVELNDGMLTVSAERHESETNKTKNWLQKESKDWKATRSFYLKDASTEDISAKLNDGVLIVTIPKVVEKSSVTKVTID